MECLLVGWKIHDILQITLESRALEHFKIPNVFECTKWNILKHPTSFEGWLSMLMLCALIQQYYYGYYLWDGYQCRWECSLSVSYYMLEDKVPGKQQQLAFGGFDKDSGNFKAHKRFLYCVCFAQRDGSEFLKFCGD